MIEIIFNIVGISVTLLFLYVVAICSAKHGFIETAKRIWKIKD